MPPASASARQTWQQVARKGGGFTMREASVDALVVRLRNSNSNGNMCDEAARRIIDLEHALFLVESFLRVGKFDKTNVDALTHIVGHALRKSDSN